MAYCGAFNALIQEDPIFWFCALSGSFLFIIQFMLNFLGDSPDGIDEGSGEIDSGKLKWLSKQAITGFLMMFGWVGLTCKKEFAFPFFLALLVAFAAGCVAILATALIFNGAKKLRSSGTVFRIEDSIGKEATVYQRIGRGCVGKISVSMYDITYEIDAMSDLDEEIDSFTRVHVIKKSDDKTVFVVPIKL